VGHRQCGRTSQHGVREQEETFRFVGTRVMHRQCLRVTMHGTWGQLQTLFYGLVAGCSLLTDLSRK